MSKNDMGCSMSLGAMKSLGYVNKYNRGIGQVQKELRANGNPKAEFDVSLLTAFAVTVLKGTSQRTSPYQSGTSQNGEYRPFGPNVLTLQERILKFCSEPKSLREIADFLGVASKKKVKAKYIDDILGTKIVMTIPDKPNSSLQKYVAAVGGNNICQSTTYTKKKEFGKEKLRQMIFEYLKNAGKDGAKRDTIYEYLKDVMPQDKTEEQRLRALGDILDTMKDEGVIVAKGRTWYLK